MAVWLTATRIRVDGWDPPHSSYKTNHVTPPLPCPGAGSLPPFFCCPRKARTRAGRSLQHTTQSPLSSLVSPPTPPPPAEPEHIERHRSANLCGGVASAGRVGGMGRSPCCEQAHTNKGAWTKEEDQRLIAYIKAHGEGCWRSLPKAAGLLRCGKSCRLRWINYLRPDLKRGNFSEEEDELIIKFHELFGNK
jgi:hypothetical protein